MSIEIILGYIKKEVETAKRSHPDFTSYHEGYGVIMEEICEMWDEIREKNQSPQLIAAEATQVAAMAIRMIELCKKRCP